MDQVSDIMRLKHYAFRTEQTYVSWIKRFIFFHDKKHPREMGEAEPGIQCIDFSLEGSPQETS